MDANSSLRSGGRVGASTTPPSEAFINFVDEVYDGSRWHCTYRKTDKGYTKWLQAEPI